MAIIIGGNLAINGTSGSPCVWTNVDITSIGGTGAASYCTVTGSTNSDASAIDATDNCTDGGGNTGWNFASASIEAALSFGIEHQQAQASAAILEAGLTLANEQGFSDSGIATLEAALAYAHELASAYISDMGIDAALSFGAVLGGTFDAQANLEAALSYAQELQTQFIGDAGIDAVTSLALSLSQTQQAIATLQASQALNLSQALAFTSQAVVAGSVAFTHELTITPAGEVIAPGIIEGAITFASALGIQNVSTANLFAATTLGNNLALVTAGGATIEAALALALEQADQYVYEIGVEGVVTLGAQFAQTTAAQSVLSGQVQLGHQIALQAITQAVLDAGLSLTAIQSVTVTGSVIIVGLVTPDGRTITIRAEDRTIVIKPS